VVQASAKVAAEEPERQAVEQMMPESNDSAAALGTSKGEEAEAEGGSSDRSESSFEDNNNSNHGLSPLTSPASMSNEAEATTELGGPSSPDGSEDTDAARHRATAWQKANFVAAKPSEQARRTVTRPHSGGAGRTTRAFLGNRSSEPGSPAGGTQPSTPADHPALKLYRSAESGSSEHTNSEDEAEEVRTHTAPTHTHTHAISHTLARYCVARAQGAGDQGPQVGLLDATADVLVGRRFRDEPGHQRLSRTQGTQLPFVLFGALLPRRQTCSRHDQRHDTRSGEQRDARGRSTRASRT